MKKNISKTIVTIAIVTAFLMPLMGNTALADTETFYFDSYNGGEAWSTNPSYMVDGNPATFASTSSDVDVQLLDENMCTGGSGSISKVEIRVYGNYMGTCKAEIILRPVFDGSTDGNDHAFTTITTTESWSPWFDITYGHRSWTWTNVVNLDCDVEAKKVGDGSFTLYGAKVEIQVTYT